MKGGRKLIMMFSNYFNTQGAKSTYQLDANFLVGLNVSPYSTDSVHPSMKRIREGELPKTLSTST